MDFTNIHPSAIIASDVKIGIGASLWLVGYSSIKV